MQHPWDRRLGVWYIAQDHPDAAAVISSPQGARTYGELAGDAHQLVHTFRSLGLQPGSAVAAMFPNGLHLITIALACQEGGYSFTPLNTHLTSAEVREIAIHSGAALVIVDARFHDKLKTPEGPLHKVATTLVASGAIDGYETLEALAGQQPREAPEDRSTGTFFPYSSGTTGKPKGIKRHAVSGDPWAEANTSAVFGRAFDFKPFEGPHLVTTGMFHGGSYAYYMGALHVGHALVITERFEPEQTLALIEQHRIATAYMVPTQFVRMLRLSEETRSCYDVSSLHVVVHSAAPCPRSVKEQMMAWWGPVIWETYGGMEGAATIAKPAAWLDHPGTVGRAIRGVQLHIIADDGSTLGANEIGQIYMVTESKFEYHNDASGTAAAFDGNRHTIGDVGYINDDGFLFISDRKKDMVITGGVNVYPAEIEALLITHPAVHDVAVIGVPDAEWGEAVKAVVELADGFAASDEQATTLLEFCRNQLASYKCPRSVDFRKDLPRTEAGKLYKRIIRDEYWAATRRAV
jgi:long-chain acyl-CoA synthetase